MKKNIQQQQYIVNHLNEYGPVIEAEIYTNEQIFLYKKNHNKPVHFKTVQLLIDTGASISGLDNSIIKSLQLPEYSELAQVEGAGGRVQLKKYRCLLYLPVFLQKGLPLDVLEGNFSLEPYHGILGRDVLQYCHFEYHGYSGKFVLRTVNF